MKKDILILGDSCVDVYTYCKSKRLAPDKPVPVLEVVETTKCPGMSYNVFCNVKSLHSSCEIITNSNWESITKNRYVHKSSNHMFVRIDSSSLIEKIDLSELSFEYETIIISDYDKGFLTEEDIEYICSNHNQVFLDTKKILGDWTSNAKFIKINNYEYERSKKFINSHLKDKVIKTMGGAGCFYQGKIYPVKKMDVIDVSGAGDTFMASLSVKYTETSDIIKSIKFANDCASKVVKKRGTTTI